jgi:hypothetical protein
MNTRYVLMPDLVLVFIPHHVRREGACCLLTHFLPRLLLCSWCAVRGEVIFTSSGVWTVPQNVRQVSVVCVGGGGSSGFRHRFTTSGTAGGSGGGALVWANNVPVTPGEQVSVSGGAAGTVRADGGNSWFRSATYLAANGGQGAQQGGKGGNFVVAAGITSFGGGKGGDGGPEKSVVVNATFTQYYVGEWGGLRVM